MAAERTRIRRPDLFSVYERLMECRKVLLKDKLHHIGMLALIERGQARLLHYDSRGILLCDRVGGSYMLTVKSKEAGERILQEVFDKEPEKSAKVELFITHQEYMNEVVQNKFGMKLLSGCIQMSYTRKESLPKKNADIRKLSLQNLKVIKENYDLVEEEVLAERLAGGFLYGIYVEDELAGFIGEHEEGSMGMLMVFPPYRGQGLAKVLESDLINRTLQKGFTPFCQIFDGNEISLKLQETLGLYSAKEKVWWFEKSQTK